MSKEVKEYLDYLKANEYIWGYEKKDNYIVLRYGLSSVKDTETNIEYNDNLRSGNIYNLTQDTILYMV